MLLYTSFLYSSCYIDLDENLIFLRLHSWKSMLRFILAGKVCVWETWWCPITNVRYIAKLIIFYIEFVLSNYCLISCCKENRFSKLSSGKLEPFCWSRKYSYLPHRRIFWFQLPTCSPVEILVKYHTFH